MIRRSVMVLAALALIGAAGIDQASAALFTGTGPGSSTIGSGGDYASLRAACDAVSTAGSLSGGDWTFFITGDLTETDDSFIGANTNGNTITFKPAASVTATISFPTTTTSGIAQHIVIGRIPGPTNVKTDNIVFDGSNSVGGTSRDLTITTSGTSRRLFGIYGDSDNFTLKNLITTGSGIFVSASTGLVPDNLLFDNCSFTVTLNLDNNISALTATNALYRECTLTNTHATARMFTLNTIGDLTFLRCTLNQVTTNLNETQMFWCGLSTGKTLTFDSCNITYTNNGGGGLSGGPIVATFVTDTINFRNNFISLVGGSTGSNFGSGMNVVRLSNFQPVTASVNFYHNSCIMRTTADTGNAGSPRFSIIRLDSGTYTVGTINFRNNAILNSWHTVTGTTAGAIILDTNTGTVVCNNNLVYVDTATDPNNRFGFYETVDYADRASWNTASGHDANSADTLNPLTNWTSNTDFHFQNQPSGAPEWSGVPVGVLTDIDGDSRSATEPTKGADEGLPYNPASVGGFESYR